MRCCCGAAIAGIGQRVRATRYAGIALLSVTLMKLFLHDLAGLGQLDRIGAFLGVAVITIIASFLYQRFLAGNAKQTEAGPEASPPAPSLWSRGATPAPGAGRRWGRGGGPGNPGKTIVKWPFPSSAHCGGNRL